MKFVFWPADQINRVEPAAAAGLRVFALAALMLALSGCQRAEPVRIGFVAGLSGRVADLGISERNGAQLAVDDANAAGGMNGQDIELVVRDDEQLPASTAQAVAEFADRGMAFVIGPMTSSTAAAGAAVATERKLVMISPAGTTHELSGKRDYFYRCVADARVAAHQQADFLYTRGARSLAVLGDQNNRAFADSYTAAIVARFQALGGRMTITADFQSGPQSRFADLAAKLLQARPDAIVIIAGAVDAALVVQHVRKLDAQVMLATTPWAGTEDLIQLGGRAVEGTFVPQYFDRSSRAESFLRFTERYRKRFGEEPGFPATIAYDAVTMGLTALGQRADGQTLHDALNARREYPGLQRPTRIDAFGDGEGALYMTSIQHGRYEPVSR